MRHYFAPSFERMYKKLSGHNQHAVDHAIESFLKYVTERKNLPKGLGLKRLARHYWEICCSIDLRIILELEDPIGFLLVGNHDDVQRFIRE